LFEKTTNYCLNDSVKKEDQDITLLNSDISLNNDFKKENFKTTNINILLNRVRLDKKRTFKKRIIFSFFLVTIITALTVCFTIY
jgi:hypothetical protein